MWPEISFQLALGCATTCLLFLLLFYVTKPVFAIRVFFVVFSIGYLLIAQVIFFFSITLNIGSVSLL